MSLLVVVAMLVVAMVPPLAFADSEKKIQLEDLPAGVQDAVRQQVRVQGGGTATLRGLTMEMEHGKKTYEAELLVNGHSKDIRFDAAGRVIALEEEVAINNIPEAARDAINKAVGDGKLIKIEQVTGNGRISYEAAIQRGSKNIEYAVDGSGKHVKD